VPRKRSNKLDLSKGLWLKTEEGKYISLSKKKLTAENITPQPIIRYGKAPPEEGSKRPIELIQSAPWPVYRSDTVSKLVSLFKAAGFEATTIYKDSDEDLANSKFNTLMTATLQLLTGIPLDTYTRGYLDRKGDKVESGDVYKYKVAGVNETGKELLEEFPYLEMTHVIEEKDETGLCIWPRIYYDMWLPDSVYQLTAKDDASRFELWRLAQKLDEYPFPIKDGKDKVKLDDEGNPIVTFEEAMIVRQGYIAQSGSTQQYHALIVPERIQAGGEDKFVFLMKLTRTIRRYAEPMDVPAPGEVPLTVMREQKPLVMESFAEMLQKAAA